MVEMKNIPKSVKESKAAEELNPDVPAVDGVKFKTLNGTVYYFTISDDGVPITAVVE